MSTYSAVIFDLGGVVFASPFDAFDSYDQRSGFPIGTTRGIIRSSSETGAWAALERGELTQAQFHDALNAEGLTVGFAIDAARIMTTIGEGAGARPEMLSAIEKLREHGFKVGALTNNWANEQGDTTPSGLHELNIFHAVIESAKVGLRKPDPRIYELACETLNVSPHDTVFLDDLGINLKPARAMGMRTVKVANPTDALRELSALVGLDLV